MSSLGGEQLRRQRPGDRACDRPGKLDVLVNNAGVFAEPLSAITARHFRRLFEINVFGLLLATQTALPLFGEAGGSIINIGSLSGRMASPGQSVYVGTKGAVDAIAIATFLASDASRWGQIIFAAGGLTYRSRCL